MSLLAVGASLSACSSDDSTSSAAAHRAAVSTVTVCDGGTELDVSYQGAIENSVLSMTSISHSDTCSKSIAKAMPKQLTKTTELVVNSRAGVTIRRRCLGTNMLYTLPYGSGNTVGAASAIVQADTRCRSNPSPHIEATK